MRTTLQRIRPLLFKTMYNSLIFDEWQNQSARVLTLLFEYNMLNKMIQIIPKNLHRSFKSASLFTVAFMSGLILIRSLILIRIKKRPAQNLRISSGVCWNHLDEAVFMAGPKPLPTEFVIHHGLESCDCVHQQPQTHYKHTHPQSCINYFWHNGLLGDYKRCLRLQEGDRTQRFGTWTECRFPHHSSEVLFDYMWARNSEIHRELYKCGYFKKFSKGCSSNNDNQFKFLNIVLIQSAYQYFPHTFNWNIQRFSNLWCVTRLFLDVFRQ